MNNLVRQKIGTRQTEMRSMALDLNTQNEHIIPCARNSNSLEIITHNDRTRASSSNEEIRDVSSNTTRNSNVNWLNRFEHSERACNVAHREL